jgi:hypothetical protein
VPKTLIFAKDDAHADRIVDLVREVFDEGNDFCKKITYRVGGKKTTDDLSIGFPSTVTVWYGSVVEQRITARLPSALSSSRGVSSALFSEARNFSSSQGRKRT